MVPRLAQRLYSVLPWPCRDWAASLHGLNLNRWRYGRETDALVHEATAREHWTAGQWAEWRTARLAYILERAATRVPFYRRYWESLIGCPLPNSSFPSSPKIKAFPPNANHESAASNEQLQQRPWLCFENWPILEKESVRADPRAFVADDCDVASLYHEHTSGTTGTPIDLWWNRDTVRRLYALFEARWRNWYGVSRHDRWAILGGQVIVAARQERSPFWVWNAPMHQLYMSVYHLRPDWISHYLDALHRYRVVYLWGYSSALHVLAEEALRLNWTPPPLKVVITNAEPLYDHQREVITRAFRCPVRESYGNAEIVAAAGECDHGRLHLWPDMGTVEVLDDATGTLGDAGTGELICTGLLNPDMPLIRYRIGDRATVLPAEAGCACGRSLPLIESLEGRADDVLVTPDGRRIGRLDPVFKGGMQVREAQIVQDAPDQVRVLIVPTAAHTAADSEEIRSRLAARLGPAVRISVETVNSIPRAANGKFRAVVSRVGVLPARTPA